MSSTFARKGTSGASTPPDPHKYVNYTLGMLLGVDEFIQEHAYLSGYDHWLTRELLGYGTTSGLHVYADIDKGKPRILVAPGVAVSPRGQLIRVTPTQCADLNDWLEEHKEQLGNSPSNPLTAYVVLGYRACPSDTVPSAGEACRSEDEAMVAARLSDDFILDLVLKAPDQREEDALRAFVAWLQQVPVIGLPAERDTVEKIKEVEVVEETVERGAKEVEERAIKEIIEDIEEKDEKQVECTTPEEFADAILDAAAHSDPSDPSKFMSGSLPTGLLIPVDQACEYWQSAFRIWVTQLRPKWRAYCSHGDVPDEDRVLLAQLTIPLAKSQKGNWQVSGADDGVIVDERERPFLLHLRLLQEWMLCGRPATSSSASAQGYTAWGGSGEQLAGRGRYNVVAAGYVRCNDTSRQASYNGLSARSTQDGTVNVRFAGYEWPNAASYIVKVLASSNTKISTCIVSFDRFMKGYFMLHVTDAAGNAISRRDLEQLELMIEVSQYTVAAPSE